MLILQNPNLTTKVQILSKIIVTDVTVNEKVLFFQLVWKFILPKNYYLFAILNPHICILV